MEEIIEEIEVSLVGLKRLTALAYNDLAKISSLSNELIN